MTEPSKGDHPRVSAAWRRSVHGRLNTLSRKINELHGMLRDEFPGAYLYFEAGGTIYAMAESVDCNESRLSLANRQAAIIAKSDGLTQYDCGAW